MTLESFGDYWLGSSDYYTVSEYLISVDRARYCLRVLSGGCFVCCILCGVYITLERLLRNPYDADNSNINGDVGLVLCYGIKDGMSIGEYWVSFSGAR